MGRKNSDFQNIFLSRMVNDDSDYIPIIADGDNNDLKNVEVPETLPVMPLRNTVLFPGVVLPITVGRKKSLRLIKPGFDYQFLNLELNIN